MNYLQDIIKCDHSFSHTLTKKIANKYKQIVRLWITKFNPYSQGNYWEALYQHIRQYILVVFGKQFLLQKSYSNPLRIHISNFNTETKYRFKDYDVKRYVKNGHLSNL